MDPIDMLIAQLADADPTVRMRAAGQLADKPDARASDALILALKDSNWRVRDDAAWALGQLRGPRAADNLLKLWDDPVGDVQQSVRHALTRIGDLRIIPRLVAELESQQEWVRYESALLLREIGDETALPALDHLAATDRGTSPNADVRGAARAAAHTIRVRLGHKKP
jgi:HEAT repeat protein